MGWLESKLKVFLVVMSALSTAGGSILWIDGRYAKAAEVVQMERRLDITELKQQLRVATDEYYFLRGQLRKYPEDLELKEKVDEAKEQVDQIRSRIKKLKETRL